jgi:hypothetical protein
MSKARRITLLVIVMCMFTLGSITEAASDQGSRPATPLKQNTFSGWCCAAGLSCCTDPPTQIDSQK